MMVVVYYEKGEMESWLKKGLIYDNFVLNNRTLKKFTGFR